VTINEAQGTAANNLTRKDYVDTQINTVTGIANGKVSKSGDTMTGNLTIRNGASEMTLTMGPVDGYIYGNAPGYGIYFPGTGKNYVFPSTGVFNCPNVTINEAQGTAANNLTRKDYVDGLISTVTANANGKMPLAGGIFTGWIYMGQNPSAPDYSHIIEFQNSYGSAGHIYGQHAPGNWVGIVFEPGNSGNVIFKAGGNIEASGNITAYSDRRIKTNLEVIPNALDKVQALTGYTFDRTDLDLPRQTGLIAQDVQAVLPEAVTNGDTLALNYGAMMGLMVEAIKELRAEVAALKGK
jgi:hypothetical protein